MKTRGMRENKTNRAKRFLAEYPLTFYFGLLILGTTALLGWLHFTHDWDVNLRQFWVWASNNAETLLLGVTFLLGLTLVASALAYRQTCKMNQEEYYLWLHQRSTRTLFPFFTPLHDWLRLHVSLYRWWHTQIYSTTFHVLFLLIALLIGFSGVRGTFSPFPGSGSCGGGGEPPAVLIVVNTTWSTNQCAATITISNNATLTINGGITVETGTLSVGNGVSNGHIAFKGDTLNNLGVYILATGNVTVYNGSTVTGNGQGYLGGTSGSINGAGTGGGSGTSTFGASAGGGGYGGAGGNGSVAGGSTYGSATAPDHLGSGGGYATANGGAGGAAIKIETAATFTINGSIQANGTNSISGGGGSGGTVWIKADSFAGSGSVTANGGNGGGLSGGGGGGRIVRQYTSAIGTELTLTAAAGNGGSAQAGTVQNTGPVTNFSVTGAALEEGVTAGSTFSLTVTAKDTLGVTHTSYTGTVAFTSNDPQAVLPSNYTFQVGDSGTKLISGFILKTAGSRTVTVTEVGNGAVIGTGTLTVNPGSGVQLSLTGIGETATAGAALNPTVTIQDTYGNVATTFTGAISWSSSDTAATLPSNYTFVANDGGVHSFSGGVTLRTAGTQTLSVGLVSGGGQPATTTLTITPSSASILELTWNTSSIVAGQKVSPTVKVRDAYGNTVTSFTGKIRFSSTDAAAVLPADYTFTGTEQGVKTFSNAVTLKTSGTKSVTVSEVSGGNPAPTATTTFTVNPSSHAGYTITATSPQKVGVGWTEVVTNIDAYGNTTTPSVKTGTTVILSLTGPAKFYTDETYKTELTNLVTTQYQTLYLKAYASGTVVITVTLKIEDGIVGGAALKVKLTASSAPIEVNSSSATDSSDQLADQTGTGANDQAGDKPTQPSTVIGQIQEALSNAAQAVGETLDDNRPAVNAVSIAAAAIAPIATAAAFGPLSASIVTGIIDTMVKGASFFGGQVGILPMRLRGRRWGRVRNRRTGLPIGGVFIELVDEHGKTIDRIMTDTTGHYAFLVDTPGRYWVQVHNPLYERFMSRPLTVNDPNQDIVNEDIELTLIEERLKKRVAVMAILLRFVHLLTFLHLPLLILGSSLSLYVYVSDPTLGKSLIVSLYVLLWSTKLLEFNYRRPFGVVVDAVTGLPQPLAVVQVVSSTENGRPMVRSTVTDGRGRFLIVIKPGRYNLTVGKEGYQPYEMAIQGQVADLTIKLKKQSS